MLRDKTIVPYPGPAWEGAAFATWACGRLHQPLWARFSLQIRHQSRARRYF